MSEEKRDEIEKGIDESARPDPETHEPGHGQAAGMNAPRNDAPKVNQTKDIWDKVDIVLKGIAAPVIVASLGFFGSKYLAERERIESERRNTLELRSKRQEANVALRKELLQFLMQNLASGPEEKPEKQLLSLEFVAANFGETLNLAPYIHNVRELISRSPDAKLLQPKFQRLMSALVDKQLLSLKKVGDIRNADLFFDKIEKPSTSMDLALLIKSTLKLRSQTGSLALRGRDFRVYVLEVDRKNKRLYVVLDSRDESYNFWISVDDLPLTNSLRLSEDERCAVVITRWNEPYAQITLVYFPTDLTLD
jgi:hypothetical protein